MQKVQLLDDFLLSMPPVPCYVEPSTHRHLLASHMLEGAEMFFPLEKSTPRVEWLSASTFSLMKQRALVKHLLGAAGSRLKLAWVEYAVQAWKHISLGTCRRPEWCTTRGVARKVHCMQQLQSKRNLASLNWSVKAAMEEDLKIWLQAKSRSMEEAALESNKRELFKLLSNLQAWTPARECRLIGGDGLPVSTDREERMLVRDSFLAKFEGVGTTYKSIVEEDRAAAVIKCMEEDTVVRTLDAVPSMPFCTLKHASASMNGTGELVTGGEIYRLLPRTTAKNVLPLLTKTSMAIRFPVQFLGTNFKELWNKSGSKSLLANFREIALADFDGKTLGAHQRRSIFQAVRCLAGKSQIGSGLNTGSTCACNLHVSQAYCLARIRKVACGTLFVDIIGAFSAVTRRIAIPEQPESEEQWRRHLHNCGYTVADANATVALALTVAEWMQAGASQHAIALLSASHATSWFSIDGLEAVTKFMKGALAGTSLADIIFVVTMARVLTVLEVELAKKSLVTELGENGAAAFFGRDEDDTPLESKMLSPVWVDDLAIPILAPSSGIVVSLQAAFACVYEVFLRFHLDINLKKGKTEIMVACNGKGAKLAHSFLSSLPGSRLNCNVASGEVVGVLLTRFYRHMGRKTVPSGGVLQEMTARHATAVPVIGRLRHKFLTRPTLSVVASCSSVMH